LCILKSSDDSAVVITECPICICSSGEGSPIDRDIPTDRDFIVWLEGELQVVSKKEKKK
jgi:hypothetical protein